MVESPLAPRGPICAGNRRCIARSAPKVMAPISRMNQLVARSVCSRDSSLGRTAMNARAATASTRMVARIVNVRNSGAFSRRASSASVSCGSMPAAGSAPWVIRKASNPPMANSSAISS